MPKYELPTSSISSHSLSFVGLLLKIAGCLSISVTCFLCLALFITRVNQAACATATQTNLPCLRPLTHRAPQSVLRPSSQDGPLHFKELNIAAPHSLCFVPAYEGASLSESR